MRKTLLAISLLFLAINLLGCGDSDYGDGESRDMPESPSMGKDSSSGFKAAERVSIVGTSEPYFEPQNVEVDSGKKLTWTNDDSLPHTVTADDGSFHSGNMKKGDTYKRTLDKKGEISYHCELHPQMKAKLRVK